MRILIVTSYFPPHVGGVEVVAERQARLLAGAGHDVVVATCRSSPAAPGAERRDGYAVRRLPASTAVERQLGIPYPVVGLGFIRALRRLVGWCEVVHLHDVLYQPPQVAAVLAVRAGRPIYATQHVGPVNHPHPVVRGVERLIGTVAGRFVWRRARRVVAYNPMVQAHLRAHGVPPDRVARGSIGVDLTAFAPRPAGAADDLLRAELNLPAGVPLVLFVGRMVEKKGYHHLVRATGPGWHLVLVGPGRPAGPAPAGATFLGPLPAERLARLHRIVQLFVLPSTGEVFPIAAQEAMASGLPVVLTDGAGYDGYGVDRDLIRLVPADPEALRRSLEEIITDADLRRRMGAYSRHLAETHFDAAAGERDIVQLYDRPSTPHREESRWTSPSSS